MLSSETSNEGDFSLSDFEMREILLSKHKGKCAVKRVRSPFLGMFIKEILYANEGDHHFYTCF